MVVFYGQGASFSMDSRTLFLFAISFTHVLSFYSIFACLRFYSLVQILRTELRKAKPKQPIAKGAANPTIEQEEEDEFDEDELTNDDLVLK